MKKCLTLAAFALASSVLFGYEASVDDVAARPGQRIAVPVRLDTVRGASHVGVRVAYDPQVLVLVKTEEGDLAATLDDDFIVVGDAKGGAVSVSAFGTENVAADVGGTLATLIFEVREGTQGLYSDVAVSDVRVGEKTGVKDITVGNAVTARSGMVRVEGESAAEGEVPVECEGETLAAEDKNRIRKAIADAGRLTEDVKGIAVAGPTGNVGLIADLGIVPAIGTVDANGILNVTYSKPTISITSFDPKSGVVGIKVVPGAGNAIVSTIATGYVHVYGSSKLGEEMQRLKTLEFDLTPYLKTETKGEAALTVDLGTHSFLKVKAAP